ncbi:MAG: trypsin-like peptidase domain-containing protein [Clostridia bacterium]|nr:trypsin-like peptidase domain-containing protein [Clostridia bacterium]
MEENRNILPPEGRGADENGTPTPEVEAHVPEVSAPEAAEFVADDMTAAAPDAEASVDEESASAAPVAENGDGESEKASQEPPVALCWEFGAAPDAPVQHAPEKTHATKRFVGVFAAVTAVFLAVLIVLLFLGDAGFKIYRTVMHERTVFVKEYNTDVEGLLAPEEAAEVVKRSTVTVVVRLETGTAIGSGFIYTADGYICTNHHVVEEALSVQVILPDGEAVDATVVGTNEMADLAVIKINKTGLTPVKLGSSAAALVGESVVAVGTPAKIDYRGTATFGRISATNRIVSLYNESGVVNKKMTLLQTDTSVNPGNSGGPLANMYGEVIGVVVMKVSYFGGTVFDGIGFAIPIDGAKIIIDALIRDGIFTGTNPVATGRSLLGIGGIGIEGGYWYSDPADSNRQKSASEVAGYTYIPDDGVYVIGVNESNAIGRLEVGDVITHINGLAMYTVYDIIDQVNRYPVYTEVTVTLKRYNGTAWTEQVVTVQLFEES